MIRIRPKQMEALAEPRQDEYHRRLAEFLRETMPQAASRFGDEELVAFVAAGVRKARSYGVESDESTARFVSLMLAVSPDFDQHEDVRRFLKHPDLDPDLKVRLLADLVAQRFRTEDI